MALDPNDARLQVSRDGEAGGDEFSEFEDGLQNGKHIYASRKHWKEVAQKPGDPSNSLWDNRNQRGLQARTGESKAVVQAFLAGLPEAAEDFALVTPKEMGNWSKKVFKELPSGAVAQSPVQTYSKQKSLTNSTQIPTMFGVFTLRE